MPLYFDSEFDGFSRFPEPPLEVDEVISLIRNHWGVTYDVKLLVRRKRLFFQIMWALLEQQSFPLDEPSYRKNLAEIIDVLNRLGQSGVIRTWLGHCLGKPRLGRALSLPLKVDERLEEFVL